MIVKIAKSKEEIKEEFLNGNGLARETYQEGISDFDELSDGLDIRYKSAGLTKEAGVIDSIKDVGSNIKETVGDAAQKFDKKFKEKELDARQNMPDHLQEAQDKSKIHELKKSLDKQSSMGKAVGAAASGLKNIGSKVTGAVGSKMTGDLTEDVSNAVDSAADLGETGMQAKGLADAASDVSEAGKTGAGTDSDLDDVSELG